MRGLSSEQMADRIGKSGRTYQKIESGERDMTLTEMKEIAKTLEIPEDLMISLDKGPIFNSFNNNQEGEYFNSYHGETHEKLGEMTKQISRLENRIDFLEKLILSLSGEKIPINSNTAVD